MSQNQRIRYSRATDGNKLVSRRKYTLPNGSQVSVELDLDAKKYQIKDAVTAQVLAEGGNTTNISVLKIQSKRGLIELGAEFASESRDRGNDRELPGAVNGTV